jgi:hypothetical protein
LFKIRTRLLYPVLLSFSNTEDNNSSRLDYEIDPFELRLIASPVSPSVIQASISRKTSPYIEDYIGAHYFLTLFSSFTLGKREKLKILALNEIIDFNTILDSEHFFFKKNVTVLIDSDANQDLDDVFVHQAHRGFNSSVFLLRDTPTEMTEYLKLQYMDLLIGYPYIVVRIIILLKLFLKEGYPEDYLTNKKQIIVIYLMFFPFPRNSRGHALHQCVNNE